MEYLTDEGADLLPVLIALQDPRLVWSACGERVGYRDLTAEPGPGAKDPNMLPRER